MDLKEQHILYELAYRLIAQENFEVLHINEKNDEIWLEKLDHKKSKVVRLLHKGFDWKNHLKLDIAQVFHKTKALKKLLVSRTVEIYNVYISTHPPVDAWEELKRPMLLKEKNPPVMNMYYISSTNTLEELKRFTGDIGISDFEPNNNSESETEKLIQNYKLKIASILYAKQKEVKSVFSFGKPFLTYILIIVNLIIFLLLESTGSSNDIAHLVQFGASFKPAIVNGEWWRIVSAMFLHGGYLHLIMNMLALYYLGIIVERIYGSRRFLCIYILAGIGGGLASFAFSSPVSVGVGASGAIFGLFGALLFFGTIHKKLFIQTMGRGILTIIAINIVIGITIPQIDMSAHLGGLVTGFLATAFCYLPKKKNIIIQCIASLLYLILIGGFIMYGLKF